MEHFPLAHEIRTLDNLMMRSFFVQMRATGLDELTIMHGWILSYLYHHQGDNIFQRDIEQKFSIGRSTVTNIIQRMEGKGLIVRRSVDHDARLKKLELTPLGLDAHQCMAPIAHALDEQLIRGISPEELTAFQATLEKLRANVQTNIEQQEKTL